MKDVVKRGIWLSRKFCSRFPAIFPADGRESEVSRSKADAMQIIQRYWEELHASVRWDSEEEDSVIGDFSSFLQQQLTDRD